MTISFDLAFLFRFRGNIRLLLILSLLLFVLLNLQPVFNLIFNFPRKLDCPSYSLRINFFVCLIIFYHWNKITFENPRKTIFLLDWLKVQNIISSLKFIFVVIVSHYQFSNLILYFGSRHYNFLVFDSFFLF